MAASDVPGTQYYQWTEKGSLADMAINDDVFRAILAIDLSPLR